MSIIKKLNEYTGEIELEIKGILKSYGKALMLSKNSLKRPYRLAKIEITYPDNSKSIVDSLLFESIRKNNPLHLKTESEVSLKVYTIGKRKGYSQILPPKTNLISFNNLPAIIKENLLWVGDDYRTNELSLLPGGFCVIIEYNDASVQGYDKIKFKELYIQKIITDYFKKQNIELEELSTMEKKKIIEIYVSKIYFREFSKSDDYEKSEYQLLWAKENNEFFPWE